VSRNDDDLWYDDFTQSDEEMLTSALWFKSFKEVKKAAFGGRQLEAVVHADKCTMTPPSEANLKAVRIYELQRLLQKRRL
jgi:hypothetical protein